MLQNLKSDYAQIGSVNFCLVNTSVIPGKLQAAEIGNPFIYIYNSHSIQFILCSGLVNLYFSY